MTLRQKILLLGLVAVSGMFLALWLQYKAYLTQSQAIEAVVRNVSAVVALSHAAHELQRERGMTAINHSKTNAQALAEQVRHTDAALAGIRGDIASLGMALTQLRTEAATGRITPLAIDPLALIHHPLHQKDVNMTKTITVGSNISKALH